MHTQILLCGTDSVLLSTRSAVLRSIGWDVAVVSRFEEIETVVHDSSIDAVVLCHTLGPEQQEAAMDVLHRHAASAKSVLLTKMTTRQITVHPDVIVSTSKGPKALIESLDHLLKIA